MQSKAEQSSSRLDAVARITQITTGVSVIVGIFVALYGLYDTKRQADLSLKAVRMTQLAQLKQVISANRGKDDAIKEFLKTLPPLSSDTPPKSTLKSIPESECFDKDTKLLLPAQDLLKRHGGRGKDMYSADCFAHFKAVGRHYDEMGTMVRLGYLDFEFLFTLLEFPDDFWIRTRDYRQTIQANWGGPGKPLPDFWINFSWLRDRYHKARRARR